MKDGWKELRLSEGFPAAEGWDILPVLSKSGESSGDLALVLSSYLQSGLVVALIEVTVTGDTVLTMREGVHCVNCLLFL